VNNIELHIERLILEGLPLSPRESREVVAGVEGGLTRLLAQGGVDPRLLDGAVVPRLTAPDIRLQAGLEPLALSRRVAGALYRGIGA
jgi:hypothetical protein